MAGISLSGLINGSFNWQTVVTDLIQVASAPVTTLQNDEATNNTELSAYAQLSGDLTSLQTASQALQGDGIFDAVSAASTTPNSTWTSTAGSGTALGNYSIDVTTMATPSSLDGVAGIGTGLSPTSVVSGVTMATMPTATAVTSGTFSVDGQQVSVSLTDSLQQVFDAISAATSGKVTGTYNPATDEINLTSSDGSPIVLGAGNDTSNFLDAVKLESNGTGTVSSSASLGAAEINAPLASAGLKSPVTGTDPSGNGSFTVNGVSISYNMNTDSVSSIVSDINNSAAGVTASYNPASDGLTLTNNATGDTGIAVADTSGTLMASLGMTTGATLAQGADAVFSVNGGGPITSKSNSLDPTVTGIAGLTVGVNTTGTQTISVGADTDSMNTAIQSFISSYNTLQSDISTMTKITTNVDGSVTTSVLSGDQDLPQWASDLQDMAFNAVSGLSGSIKSLSDIGIDFTGTGSTLSVTDQTALTNALSTNPAGVGAFFQTPTTGFSARLNTYVANLLQPNSGGLAVATNALNATNTDDANKITALQAQIADEQTSLTNEFLAMQTAQSAAQSDQAILNGMFGNGSSSSSSSSSSSTPSAASVVSPSSG
jgi:flagellar hook-associated protein 2